MRLSTLFLATLLTLTLTHCASYDFSRRFVQQGNQLPPAKIERLRVGMSKEDVAVLMGTSLLSPTFDNNRWDYAYTRRKGSSRPQIRNLTVYFTNNRVVRIEHHP
jgi:outer membrane protein assembly factor BamE